jgi:hypothetical protein
MFGGYPSFRDIPRMRRFVPYAPRLGKVLRVSSGAALQPLTSPEHAGLLE